MVQRAPRVVMAATLSLLLTFALVGCGGGGSDKGEGAKGEKATTTARPTTSADATTTVAEGAPASEETKALAEAATLHPEDFGDGWEIYSDTKEVSTGEPNDECAGAAPDAGFADLPEGAIAVSPTMQLAEEQHFVGAEAYVFPDEASAQALTLYLNGDEWASCVRKQLQDFQDEQNPDANYTVELDVRTETGLGTRGFEAFGRFSISDAEGNVVGYTSFLWYRLGNVVIRVTPETGAIDDQEAYQASYDDLDAALAAAYARVSDLGITAADAGIPGS